MNLVNMKQIAQLSIALFFLCSCGSNSEDIKSFNQEVVNAKGY